MHHLLEYINQDIKGDKSEDKDSTVNETESKEIHTLTPVGPKTAKAPSPYRLINRLVFKLEPPYLIGVTWVIKKARKILLIVFNVFWLYLYGVSKSAANIYPSNKYDFFPVHLL